MLLRQAECFAWQYCCYIQAALMLHGHWYLRYLQRALHAAAVLLQVITAALKLYLAFVQELLYRQFAGGLYIKEIENKKPHFL